MLESAFDIIFKRMPEAVWLVSADGKIMSANPAASEAIGVANDEQLGKLFAAFVEDAPAPVMEQLTQAMTAERVDEVLVSLRTPGGLRQFRMEITRVDGDDHCAFILRCDRYKWVKEEFSRITRHFDIMQKTLLEQKRREFEILGKARNVDKDRELFQSQALRDSLTNIANRRAFKRQLLDLWTLCRRDGLPLAELMIDVDRFKQYNDHFGHPAGDHCLTLIGRALGEALHRDQDFVARVGGEEFAVLLPDCSIDGAATVSERLRAHVWDQKIAHAPDSGLEFVSISIGCAVGYPCAGTDSGTLNHLADELLYQAKQGGRNRIRVGAIESDWSGVVPVLQLGDKKA